MRLEDHADGDPPDRARRRSPSSSRCGRANREHTGPWDPTRDESFYTRGRPAPGARPRPARRGRAGQRVRLRDPRHRRAATALIGRVALSNVVRGPWQNATLGYWIDKDALGRGHATRAVRLVAALRLRARRPAPRAAGDHPPQRRARSRVAEKAGFRLEGRALRYLKIDGRWEDHDVYALTAEDWEAMRGAPRAACLPCRRALPANPPAPAARARRVLRDLVRETRLDPGDFVLPLFVEDGLDGRDADRGDARRRPAVDRRAPSPRPARPPRSGIPAVLLFGIPADKDEEGSGAWDDEGVVQLATRAIKEAHPDLLVIADVCLCEYTSHGHCGVLRADGAVDNDATLELLARTARLATPRAGADIVAPSDMMDGRVGAIRAALDDEGFADTPILAYSAKFASAFYGPFREAADSTPAFGDRRGYQMDPANGDEALREALLDVEEGADIVMVKPALPYLDVIRRVKDATRLPVAAYNVSGEYAMVKAAAAAGYLDERAAVLETLTVDPPRRRRHRHHLPREGRRPMASATDRNAPSCAAARTAPRPARRPRQAPAQPDAGRASRSSRGPTPRVAAAGRDRPRSEVLRARPASCSTSASSARSRRSSTRARSATARCSSPRRSTPRTRGARRRSSTRTPASRTTTCATTSSTCGSRSPSRRTRSSAWRARSTCSQELTGAESIRQLPTLQAVQDPHGPRDGGRHRRRSPSRRVAERRRSSSSRSPTTSSTSP